MDAGDISTLLADMPTPPARDGFWEDLRVQMGRVEISEGGHDERVVVLGERRPDRRRTPRVVVACAAAVALVVVGLVVIGHREDAGPAGPTPDTSTPESSTPTTSRATSTTESATTPSTASDATPRPNATITDPLAIDLDPWLTGAPAWPPDARESYLVFDVASLPTGWVVESEGGGNNLPAVAAQPPSGYSWVAIVRSTDGARYAVGARLDDGRVQPTGDSTDVGQLPGWWDGTSLYWHLESDVLASVVPLQESTPRDDVRALASLLTPTSASTLTGPDRTGQPNPDPAAVMLGGSIGGATWTVALSSTPSLTLQAYVDDHFAAVFSGSTSAPGISPYVESLVEGVPNGVLVLGTVPDSVGAQRVMLTDGATVTLPTLRWNDRTVFVTPIPEGLDVRAIQFLAADATVLHTMLLPPFGPATRGGSAGTSLFGDPDGLYFNGCKSCFDRATPSGPTPTTLAPTDGSTATTTMSTTGSTTGSTDEVPASTVDVIGPWPSGPTELGPPLPYLLPTTPIDGLVMQRGDDMEETPDSSPLATRYMQTFVSADQLTVLTIATIAQPIVTPVAAPTATVGPWAVSDRRMVAGAVAVDLSADAGLVTLTAYGDLTRTDLLAVAEGLRDRPDRAGWNASVLPHGFVPYSDGWDTAGPLRDIRWVAADGTLHGELVYGNVIDQLPSVLLFGSPSIRTIGTRTVYVLDTDTTIRMFWREADGVFAQFALVGASEDEAASVVAGLTIGDRAQWNAVPARAPSTNDGCDSLFC